ncbi:GAP1-N2 domain-containing protein [Paenibacillus agricola]|uniref:Cadherin-like beta sandwich domain-containing protein n=1 Tax=Paenibacillus agricola TaxID=2716264 RepID=A0ABX0JE81_9BACL|nr:cadherin-like beta sandwich domain-containing protein [Paenibacillus agricola]NHN33013.1 cadherin-like beta sandwich domain-containing protein [Paenibacillus agricola]
MMDERKAIQQQYFTRDREGVFRTSEGFDTVAKSEGLDVAFIKTTLNPFCIYKAPKELLGRGEEDVSLYPESLVVFHADNGDMVIGRSCFVGADFTGQRSASFTHQFIVPKERKEQFLRNPERLLQIRSFQSAYDIRAGKVLPELDDIEYDPAARNGGIDQTEQLLTRLRIDQTRFQQLVYTVMSSVTNKKKVYIVLDTHVVDSAELAKQLLQLIYNSLPYATRRQLGFMTFSSEPEGKQGLHIIFVEKGGIRQPDRNIEREHLFDFPNNRFIHNELPAQEHKYLDFIWQHRHSPDQLDPLFEFCDEALQGTHSNTTLRVQSYDELFTLYEIEQGNHALYEANRAAAMQAIATYANAETIQQKNRLNQLFITLLRKDAMDATILPDADYIKSLLQYYAFADEGVRKLVNTCFVLFISRAASRSDDEGMAEAAHLFDQLLGQDHMFDAVMSGLHGHQAGTAERYVAYRMEKAGGVKALIEEIRFWIQHGESMVQQRFFTNEVLKKVKRLLQTDTVIKQVEAANTLYRYFDELPERANKPQYEDFCGQLKLEIRLELLESLKPASLEYEEIVQLGFMLEKTDQELNSHLDSRQRLTMHLLSTIYKILLMAKKEDSELVKAIDRLDTLDLERVQEALKKLLFSRIAPEHFSKIVYAFYRPSLGRNSGYVAEFDYYGLLEYLMEKGRDMVYDFLVWSAEDSRFLNPKQGIDANYRAALSKFFDIHAPRAFRDKDIKQKLMATQNDSFIAFYKVVKLRQSEEWVRFLVKNKRLLTRSVLSLLGLIVLLVVFRSPLMMLIAYIGPAPVLVVEAMPIDNNASTVTLQATADEADSNVQLFINGEFIGNGKGSKTVELQDGNNVFEFKAVNRGGKASEVVRKELTYAMPAPIVTIEALPEVTRNSTITIKVGAADVHDPSPTLYINGEAAGQSSVTKTVDLKPGENMIEIKATNKRGKTSEPILKKIKYEPAVK